MEVGDEKRESRKAVKRNIPFQRDKYLQEVHCVFVARFKIWKVKIKYFISVKFSDLNIASEIKAPAGVDGL